MTTDRLALIDAVLRAAATQGCPTAFAFPESIQSHQLGDVLQYVGNSSLDGLLAEAVRLGGFELTPEQQTMVATLHRRTMGRVLMVETTLLDLCAEFDRRGVRFRLLKGVALANGLYERPDLRPFTDADVLVHADDIDAAVAAGLRLGFTRLLPEIRAGFDRRFAKDITLVRDGFPIDLHRTLIDGPFGTRLPIETLFTRAGTVTIAGRALPTLDALDQYLHAALTAGAADDPPRLITLRDMLELERAHPFTVAEVLQRVAAWRIAPAVARAVVVLERELRPSEPPVLSSWARQFAPSRSERMAIWCYLGPNRSYRRAAAAILTQPTWSDRVRYAAAIAVPSREYLAARSWTRRTHLSLAVRRLFRVCSRRQPGSKS